MPTIQEEITRFKELIFGDTTKEPLKEGCGGDEITYIKYDDVNMKYAYICKKCGTIWKNNIKI